MTQPAEESKWCGATLDVLLSARSRMGYSFRCHRAAGHEGLHATPDGSEWCAGRSQAPFPLRGDSHV